MSFIMGPYTITWNGSTLGQTQNGINFSEPGWGSGEPIIGDNLGPECHQDFVLGNGNCFATFICNEYDAAAMRAALSLSGTVGRLFQAGISAYANAKALVFTRTSSDTTAVPATRTCSKAILAPGQNIEYLMATAHRKVPLRFQLLPYVVTGTTYANFVDT